MTADRESVRAEVVPIRAEVEPAAPPKPAGRLRRGLERRAERGLPSRRHLAASGRWWWRTGLPAVGLKLVDLPLDAMREAAGPIRVGFCRAIDGYSAWRSAVKYEQAAAEAEPGKQKAELLTAVERRKSGRTLETVAALLAAAVGVWLAVVHAPGVLVIAAFVLFMWLDILGRRHRPEAPLPAPKRVMLAEGVPLRQLTASICEIVDRELGQEDAAGVETPMSFDPTRREFRVVLSSYFPLEPVHARAIERGIGAADYAARFTGTEVATNRRLTIKLGDPLGNRPTPPVIPSGSRSIVDGVELGVSVTDTPFVIPVAGVHVAVVMQTGGGKTKALLWALINGLSACWDAVLWGVDLAHGPALPMWRGVLQRTAYTPEDAERLLLAALAEIQRRMQILTALAEDDDPTNDADEWHNGLGPALVIVVDEEALLATHAELLGYTEQIVRTGRKVWVSLVMATQKSGNSDFGSTVMQTQVGVKILGPCDRDDTVRLIGKELRDQGWLPHLLLPAVEGAVRDAGKCYVWSPMHRTADVYGCFAPLRPGEVKARARQRVADGLPQLAAAAGGDDVAVEVAPILHAFDQAFTAAGMPDRLPTAELLEWLRGNGWPDLTEARLAELARDAGVARREQRWTPPGQTNAVRGYWWADIAAVLP